jgi:trimethylamine--corrinoid protein Co-methyltransferase
MNSEQIEQSTGLFGKQTVEMLMQVHQDALWMLENLGVGCRQLDIQNVFQKFEDKGQAIVYEDRIYLTTGLVEQCLSSVPGVTDFFVPCNRFFIGGTAPYVYDDLAGCGGVIPTAEHVVSIARIAEENRVVAGKG